LHAFAFLVCCFVNFALMGKPAETAVVGSRSFRLLFELYYESVLNQQKEMTKKEKNKYYVGGSSSRCCRVSIASHTRRFNFSHFHPPCLLIYTKQRNKSRKDSINVKKKKIEKNIRRNIHPQMGVPPLTKAVHCVCDSFQFGFFRASRTTYRPKWRITSTTTLSSKWTTAECPSALQWSEKETISQVTPSY
jgi:hypothetical protein